MFEKTAFGVHPFENSTPNEEIKQQMENDGVMFLGEIPKDQFNSIPIGEENKIISFAVIKLDTKTIN